MDSRLATLNRRELLSAGALAAAPVLGCAAAGKTGDPSRADAPRVPPFELEELGLAELQAGLTRGQYTAARLVELYARRIEEIDRSGPRLASVLELNPDAHSIAEKLDRERASGRVRGPLHGIPVLLKDNIDTGDRMLTSAGSLALGDTRAPRDAWIARRLREAGAVILGKTNLSEWANIRSFRSTSGWSARGGLTRNPYALDRNPSGSSSGTGAAIAASLAAVGVGTETDGSILSPSNACGLVGIKPTVGLVSRSGIVPISRTQDTAGPMCRSVRDAAALLSALAGSDPADEATAEAGARAETDYTRHCGPTDLRGLRLGVVRELFNAGPKVDEVMASALDALRACGAELVDPVEIPSLRRVDAAELEVLLYELKAGLESYLASRGPEVPCKSLADVIRFNDQHRAVEMPYFGQELFLKAQEKGPLTAPEYLEARQKCRTLAREQGLDRVLAEHRLDALLAPTGGPAWLSDLVLGDHVGGGSSTLCAVAGAPAITVPAGQVFGLPVGLSFMGPHWSEGRLIRCAFAFEQATRQRRRPSFAPGAALSAT